MQKSFTFFVFLVLVLTACNQPVVASDELHDEKRMQLTSKKPIPRYFIPSGVTILAAGDSLTKGIGDSRHLGGYIPYLESKLLRDKGISTVQITNLGVKGIKSIDLVEKLKKEEMRAAIRSADLVILTIGGNDIMKVVKDNISHLVKKDFQAAKTSYETNLKHIIESIRAENRNSQIILVGLYNPFHNWFSNVKEMDEILTEWNASAQNVISSYSGTYFVKIDDVFENPSENLLYNDYFHPNDKGYSIIAYRIYHSLTKEVIYDLRNRR